MSDTTPFPLHRLCLTSCCSVADLINRLVNGGASNATAAAQPSRQPPPISESDEDARTSDHVASDQVPDLPLIRVRLNLRDWGNVLDSAPSRDVSEAWRRGKALPNAQRRLRLVLKSAPLWLRAPTLQDSASEAWALLYDEGRRWWRGEVDKHQ